MKMSVLVSDTTPLHPPLWGGPLRIYELYSNFDESDITYVGLNIGKGFEESEQKLKYNLKEVVVGPDKKFFNLRKLQLKFFKGLTFDLYTYLMMKFDKNFNKKLNQV